jgi:glutathione S-transferase
MRLFYAPASPFARIVRVALLETGIDASVRSVEVTSRDPASALLPFNPVGRVPTLELDDGTILTESLLILDYIDAIQSAAAPKRGAFSRSSTSASLPSVGSSSR